MMISQRQRLEDEIGSAELDWDGTGEPLADHRCRSVLSYLVQADGRADLAELSRSALAGDAERAQLRLHHVVLPKLDDVGLLTYDLESQTVELARAGSRVYDVLLWSRSTAGIDCS